MSGLSNPIPLPDFTFVPINQWQTVLYEDGGSNYAPGTGIYTIPVSGVYQLNASVAFDQFSANSYSGLKFFINGINTIGSFETGSSTSIVNANKAAVTLKLTAGDTVQVQVFTNTGTAQNVIAGGAGICSFSITLIH